MSSEIDKANVIFEKINKAESNSRGRVVAIEV